MTNPSRPKYSTDEVFAMLRAQEARKAQRCEAVSTLVTTMPVPDQLLQEIGRMNSEHQGIVLRHHPGEPIARKLASLWSVLDVFELAHCDLQNQLNRFHAFSFTTEMFRPLGREPLKAIEVAVKRELVAFSMAASALVEHARRACKVASVVDFDSRRMAAFDGPEHRFVTSVRNLISHEEFPDVGWRIQNGETRTTDFTMSSAALLASGELNLEAKKFIERCGEQVFVSQVAASYSAKVRTFYAWYRNSVELALPPVLEDYRRVLKHCRAESSRLSHRLLLHHYLKAKVDPYKHLDKVLLPAEIDAALEMSYRSKEQVDFIIAAADEYGACNDELRQMVYRLFLVTGSDAPAVG